MLAMAMDEGYKEIHLYGVDMANGSEYQDQRPSCEYFIGLARGAGIIVAIPSTSDLLKTPILYGYEEEKQSIMKFKYQTRLKELDQRLIDNEEERTNFLIQQGRLDLIKENYFLLGAREDTDYFLKQWT
jgi:hypothetical protein